jgi:hypothetical protein
MVEISEQEIYIVQVLVVAAVVEVWLVVVAVVELQDASKLMGTLSGGVVSFIDVFIMFVAGCF